ncbi:hypothetical protein [Hyalangium versicolor]|uniref:hypothetical protein n=1 Tax=Hyalangium versicolor TaxID=2861190 RepID=UPI001CCCFF48|nr:hypothetical protein [Hyalangium versicolor]
MSDTTVIPPEEERTLIHNAMDPSWHVDYATLPPDVTLKPDGIVLKRPILVGSVAVMVFFSFILFFVPFFSGLFGGMLGGYHAGRMKRALAAGVVTSVMVPALIAGLSFFSEQPGLLFLMGLTFREWIIAHVLGTLIGAASGAFMRPRITDRELWEHRYA